MTPLVLNYLKRHRKRSGLTQRELATLLGGGGCETRVSRYERLVRKPDLEAALACQVIFNISCKEVFPDVYAAVEASVIARAHLLLETISALNPTARNELKLRTLEAIIDGTPGAH